MNLFKKKIKKIKDVQDFLSEIPNINLGGCGVSALSMYRWLEKNNELDNSKFIFLYNNQEHYLNNSNVLKEGDGSPLPPTHCCISHEGKFKDSRGDINITEYSKIHIIDEKEFLEKALKRVEKWNHDFDRENIKHIEKGLGIDLSDIKMGDAE